MYLTATAIELLQGFQMPTKPTLITPENIKKLIRDRRMEFIWNSGDFHNKYGEKVRENNEGSYVNRKSGSIISLVSLVDLNRVRDLFIPNPLAYLFSKNYRLFRNITRATGGIAIPESGPYRVVTPSSYSALRKYCQENREYRKCLERTIDYFLDRTQKAPASGINIDTYNSAPSAGTHARIESMIKRLKE